MSFPRQLKFSCPYCRRVYARSISPVHLGPGARRCPRCHREFADGSIEWPVLSQNQKIQYVFPDVLRVYSF